MGKALKIEELSREELIEVIKGSGALFCISEHHIRMARFESLTRKAAKLADRAMATMELKKGPGNYPDWRKAARDFDRAMRMSDRACRIFDGDKA